MPKLSRISQTMLEKRRAVTAILGATRLGTDVSNMEDSEVTEAFDEIVGMVEGSGNDAFQPAREFEVEAEMTVRVTVRVTARSEDEARELAENETWDVSVTGTDCKVEEAYDDSFDIQGVSER
jgi:hypothetical protein